MTRKITLKEALELVTFEQGVDDTWYIVKVHDSIQGSVDGSIFCDVNGGVGGDVKGTVNGNVHGNINGTVLGNVDGNVHGNVSGNIYGNVEGYVGDTINGREWQYVETPKDKLRRLIQEGAHKAQLLEAFDQLEDN